MNKRLFKVILRVSFLLMLLGGLLQQPQKAQAQPPVGNGPAAASTLSQELAATLPAGQLAGFQPGLVSPDSPACGGSSPGPSALNGEADADRPADDPSQWLANSSDPNSPSVTTTDLKVTVLDEPDPVAPGAQLTYRDVVKNVNNNCATAANVRLENPIHNKVAFVSATTSKGSCSYASGKVSCQLGNLAANESATVTILVIVDSDASGTLVNTATVTGDVTDSNPSNNTDSEATLVLAEGGDAADLELTIADAPDPVASGENLTYIDLVSNVGALPASSVKVVNTLPSEVTYVSATPTQGSCTHSGNQVTCNLGTLAAGASAQVNLVTTVSPSFSGTLIATGIASMAETDPNINNNADSEGTLVASMKDAVDIRLSMVDAPDPALPGQELEYVSIVENMGGLPATGVVMTDTLPAGVTFTSATTTQGTCNLSGDVVICNLGDLAANGASARISIRLNTDHAFQGVLINTAAAQGIETDINPNNNWDNEGTQVIANADLAVEIDSTPNPVKHTKDLTYSLNVQNNGPSDATGVALTHALPAGVVFVSAVSSQGTCSHSAGTLTCAIGSLPVSGSPVTVTVVVYLPGDMIGNFSSKAEVRGNEYDPCAINDEAVEETLVRGLYFMPIIRNSVQCPFCSQVDD